MKFFSFVLLLFLSSNSFSQDKKDYAGLELGQDNIGIDCDEDLLNKFNYSSSRILENPKDFYSEEFKNDLKQALIMEISSSIRTSTTISSSNSLKNIIGKKSRDSKARITAIGAAVFPKYMICDTGEDYQVAFIIVNRKQYEKAQFDNFKRTLVFHARNLNNLISRMDLSVTKKFLKKKVKFYTIKMDEIGALLPLIELNEKDNKLMQEFSINVSQLENLYDQIKQKKRFKFKELLDKAKEGINNIIEGI
tara:strand:+ start:800 stop:1549 length:750 start_codon:yes stop_codon:yes gene_type:complete